MRDERRPGLRGAAAELRAALELVTGRPFTGTGSAYHWVHVENLESSAIVAVDDAAHRLADRCLDAADLAGARWAARRGLLVAHGCEICYRYLLRAASSPVEVEALMDDLRALVADDDGPDGVDRLDPETVELYEQLTRRRLAL